MNSFTVTNATYNGSAPGELNPLVLVVGTVNGKSVRPVILWDAIQSAAAVGASTVQALLGTYMLNLYFSVYTHTAPLFQKSPYYPLVQVTPVNGDPNQTNAVCIAALVGSWTA